MDITLSLIQTNLFWEDKSANLKMFQEKITTIESSPEVIILPEMFSTGFTMNAAALAEPMEGETFMWMKELAHRQRAVIAGSIIVEDKGKFFNRFICMLPNGSCGFYDKRHLFAYAGEDKIYSAGNKRLIASVKGWKINFQVCYDLRFPVWARQQSTDNESEYDILVYAANWPQRRSHAWRTLLSARAIENQCFVIGVNRVGTDGNDIYYSGDSSVINPVGEIYYHFADNEDVCTITLKKEELMGFREKFPFLKDADDFKILI